MAASLLGAADLAPPPPPPPLLTEQEQKIKRIEDCFNYLAEFELFRRIYMVFVRCSLVCLHAILSIEDFSKVVDSMEPVTAEPDVYKAALDRELQSYLAELMDPLRFPGRFELSLNLGA